MGWHWVSCDVLKSLLKAIKFGKLTQQDQGQAVILSVETNHSAMPMNLYVASTQHFLSFFTPKLFDKYV